MLSLAPSSDFRIPTAGLRMPVVADPSPADGHEEDTSEERVIEASGTANPGQIAPYPTQQLLILALCRLSEPIAMTSSFPYLFFMIRDFHIVDSEKAISRYAGILASCFSLSQVFSGIDFLFKSFRGDVLIEMFRYSIWVVSGSVWT
jgi:hypothetical protein